MKMEPGKITMVHGDNGCGKSNFLKIISGVLLPDYAINAFLPENTDTIRASGFFQPIRFDPQLSLKKNKQLWGITPYPDDQLADYQANIERLGLTPYLKTQWGAASSGTRQKFGVAMALARKADLYFLDEPLAHVDATASQTIAEMIREKLNANSAFLITTHLADNWPMDFDHVYSMESGSIKPENP